MSRRHHGTNVTMCKLLSKVVREMPTLQIAKHCLWEAISMYIYIYIHILRGILDINGGECVLLGENSDP